MQDFIFRDNKDILKDLVCLVPKPSPWSGSRSIEPTKWLVSDPEKWNDRQRRASLGEIPSAKKYAQCQHCGLLIRQAGLGSHARSLRCLSVRAGIQANLEGYALAPIQYCNLTSPFARRYPTKLFSERKRRTHLELQVHYEVWFAQLWLKYAVDQPCTNTAVNNYIILSPNKLPDQRPPEHLLQCFKELAAAKRRNSKRGIQQALDNLQLTIELVDNA